MAVRVMNGSEKVREEVSVICFFVEVEEKTEECFLCREKEVVNHLKEI